MMFDEPIISNIKRIGAFLFLFMLLCPSYTKAQVLPVDAISPFNISVYNSQDGLPQNSILKIKKNQHSEFLLLTGDGLCTFNGNSFKNLYPSNDETTYIDFEEKNDTFYICTGNGDLIVTYKNNVQKYFTHPYGFVNIKLIGNQFIFLTENGEIVLVNRTSPIQAKKIRLVPQSTSYSFMDTWGDKIFLGTPWGLFETDTELSYVKKQLEGYFIKRTKKYKTNFFVLTGNAIFRINPTGKPKMIFSASEKEAGILEDFAYVNDSTLYLISKNHIFQYNIPQKKLYRYTDELTSKTVLSEIFYDPEENKIFIGTTVNGFYKLNENIFFDYAPIENMEGNSMNSIVKMGNGRLIASTYCGNIYIKKDTFGTYIKTSLCRSSMSVINNEIWAGISEEGIMVYKNGQPVRHITYRGDDMRKNNIFSIYKDSKNTVWAGSNNGLHIVKDDQLIPVAENIISGKINTILEVPNDFIIAGGKKGVYIINKKNSQLYWINYNHGLACKEVRAIYEDKNGLIWIGTTGGGLYCFYNHTITSINRMPGCMLNNDIFSFIIDPNELICMTSNNGLYAVYYQDLYYFFMGTKKHLVPYRYNIKDGMSTTEFNGGFQNNAVLTGKGTLIFPTVRGITEFYPPPYYTSEKQQKVFIESLSTNDTSYTDLDKNIILSRKNNFIEISYNSTSYNHADNVYYQYKLSEVDNDWGPLVTDVEARYNALPAGAYTFYVRAINAKNDPFPQVAKVSFTIKPYFYETLVFKIGVIFFMVMLTFFVIMIQQRRMRKKTGLLRQIMEYELKAVQAQMNPHFIFNCLSSIKYLISSGKNTEAEEFLDRFAFLVRKFLETSRDIYVSVQDEVAMLKEYLELEKMRFQDSFSYTIETEKELSTQLIPTMLVQPFIENSIKHGIMHLREPGCISIRFHRETSFLICQVEDNGIGRVKSGEINKKREHISRGISIVEEKKEIISKLFAYSVEIIVTDKYNDEKQSTGTIVTIKIPLK